MIIKKSEFDNKVWAILLDDDLLTHELSELLEIGSLIWQRGWAEANAGNVSIRLPESFDFITSPKINSIIDEYFPDASQHNSCEWFLASASNTRFREYPKYKFSNFVLCGVNSKLVTTDSTNQPVIIPVKRKPTSEWITHLSAHNWLSDHRPEDKVILHAHPTDWIALSSTSEYLHAPEEIFQKLYDYLPELKIYLPDGIASAGFSPPGSEQLALQTVSAMEKSRVVVWDKHGIVITAENIMQAYDYLEIVSKAATVYLTIKNR